MANKAFRHTEQWGTVMIEGLKVDIASAELQVNLEERAEYHQEKAEWYASQVESLQDGGVTMKRISNDPVASLVGSAATHTEKATYFSFLAKHIIPDEIYRLSEADLGSIELSSRYYPGIGGIGYAGCLTRASSRR